MDFPTDIQAFFAFPTVIESHAPENADKSTLFVHAIETLHTSRSLVVTLPADWNPAGKPATDIDEPLSAAEYENMVGDIREQVARMEPLPPDYKIEVVDVTQNRTPFTHQADFPPIASHTLKNYIKSMNGTAFSFTLPDKNNHVACTVIGFPPKETLRRLLGIAYRGPANFGMTTKLEFHRGAYWHEIGHCLLGQSEAYADAFGLLMSIRDGASKDYVASIATVRDALEFLNPNSKDLYYTSASAGWIARNYNKLKSSEILTSRDFRDVATLAKGIVDRVGFNETEIVDFRKIRKAMVLARDMSEHWIRTTKGLEKTDFHGWIVHNAERSPVFARVLDIKTRLTKGPTDVPTPFVVDLEAFHRQVAALASEGDPTAVAMLNDLNNQKLEPLDRPYRPVPFEYPNSAEAVAPWFTSKTPKAATADVRISSGFSTSREPTESSPIGKIENGEFGKIEGFEGLSAEHTRPLP